MSRRRAAVKRTLLKDPKYNDTLVSKFVCSLMKHGKKSVAERILYGALDLISDREKETPSLDVFRTAVENVKPAMEVKSRRVGGFNLPGSHAGSVFQKPESRNPLVGFVCQCPEWKIDAGQTCRRVAGCLQQPWKFHQEKRRYPQDGRSQ
jgi:hypothetical protein